MCTGDHSPCPAVELPGDLVQLHPLPPALPGQAEYVVAVPGQGLLHLVVGPDTLALSHSNTSRQSCFYSGYVQGVASSSVAVSLCQGMVSSTVYVH